MGFATAGAFTGPFLGVWMSLYAATHGRLGIVSTLMATTPVLLIPLAYVFRKEKPTVHEILGAVVAVAGVALLLHAAAPPAG
jgi:drug/metabolite transporter (DMT)-like permease